MHRSTLLLGTLVLAIGFVGLEPFGGRAEEATPDTAPTYDCADLDGNSSRAYGINNRGWIVGYADDAEGRRRAVLWEGDRTTDLGTLGGDEAEARAVNDAGQIVGVSTTAPGQELGAAGARAFLWEGGG